jgi:hypothetical protein
MSLNHLFKQEITSSIMQINKIERHDENCLSFRKFASPTYHMMHLLYIYKGGATS